MRRMALRWRSPTPQRYPLPRAASTSAPFPPKRTLKPAHAGLAAALTGLSAFTLGALFPPPVATLLAPRTAPAPLDPAHPAAQAYLTSLEAELDVLTPLAGLRTAADADEWYETRPYAHYPPERAVNSLTAGALRGPGRLAIPPLVRARRDERESYVFVHVGRGVCGHDGIVHGGLLATLLDEALARTVRVFLFRGLTGAGVLTSPGFL